MAHITTKKVELTKLIRTTTVFLIHYLRMMVTILTSIQKNTYKIQCNITFTTAVVSNGEAILHQETERM